MFTITARLINPGELEPDSLLARAGLQRGGPVQCMIDQRVIDYCQPYVPASPDRTLEHSAQLSTEIGEGLVIWATPYARLLYYNVVYGPNIPRFDPDTGVLLGFFSPPKKHPTDRHFKFDKSQNPNAGPFWVERMKADHLSDIVKEAQNLVKKELK